MVEVKLSLGDWDIRLQASFHHPYYGYHTQCRVSNAAIGTDGNDDRPESLESWVSWFSHEEPKCVSCGNAVPDEIQALCIMMNHGNCVDC
jgi:hypothetical protein